MEAEPRPGDKALVPTEEDQHAADELLRCHSVGQQPVIGLPPAFVEDLSRLFMYRRLFEQPPGVPPEHTLGRFAKALAWASRDARGRLPDWFHEIAKEAEAWARTAPGDPDVPNAETERGAQLCELEAERQLSEADEWRKSKDDGRGDYIKRTEHAARVLQSVATLIRGNVPPGPKGPWSYERHEASLKRLVKAFGEHFSTIKARDGADLTVDNIVDEVIAAFDTVCELTARCDEHDKEVAAIRARVAVFENPIPMRLTCPGTVPDGHGGLRPCGQLHVDKGEFATKVHHTHSCQHCGMTWRPAVHATVGVDFLPGFRDES